MPRRTWRLAWLRGPGPWAWPGACSPGRLREAGAAAILPALDDLPSLVRVRAAAQAGDPQAVADIIRAETGRRWVGVHRVDGGDVVDLAWSGPAAPAHPRFPAGRGLTGVAIAAGATVVSHDVAQDPRHLTALDSTGSEMMVPVVVASRAAGTLDVEDPRTGAFTDGDRAWFEALAAALADLYR